MKFIGLDLHQTSIFGSVQQAGEEVFRFEVETRAEHLRQAIEGIQGPKRVVVEEGNLSDWCKRTLEEAVDELVICDPRHNRLISTSEDKMDPVDARRLGLLFWLGQVRSVYHADPQTQQLKEAVISYWQSSQDVTRAKNRLKSQLARRGVVRPKALYRSEGFQRARRELAQTWGQTEIVDSLFAQLQFFRQQQAERLRYLRRQQAPHRQRLRLLRTIPGVGPLVAVTWLAFIGDPWRFSNKRKLWKYCGLAVKSQKSNGRFTKPAQSSNQYNRRLKHVLGIAAQATLRCQDENWLTRKGQDLLRKTHNQSNVRRDLSRKIAVIAWSILKNPVPFRKEADHSTYTSSN